MVQWFSDAPTARIRSAWAINAAAIGEANPPEMPSEYGLSANSPWAGAEVASAAPITAASPSSSGPASE